MWMDVLVSNAAMATVLAAIVLLVTRYWRRPPVVYWLWLLVLLKLVTPPVAFLSIPIAHNHGASEWTLADWQQKTDEVTLPGWIAEPTKVSDAPAATMVEPPALFSDMEPPRDVSANDRQTPRTPLDWRSIVAVIWTAGSALWVLVAVVRIVRFERLAARAQRSPEWLQQEAQRIADRYRLRRCPPVRVVSARVPPLVWAIHAKPLVLLPTALVAQLTREQLSALLAHELAHVARRDQWIRRLEMLVLAVYWWHPVAWLARRRLQEAEEACCDAWVTWTLPGIARGYADALVRTVEFLSGAPRSAPAGASGIAPVRLLERRIEMILSGKTKRRLSWNASLCIVAAWLMVLPWSIGAVERAVAAPQVKADPTPVDKPVADDVDLLDELLKPTAEPTPTSPQDTAEDPPVRIDPNRILRNRDANERGRDRRESQALLSDPPRPWEKSPDAKPNTEIKVFNLSEGDAHEMVNLIRTLFEGRPLRVAADGRTNSLIAVGTLDDLVVIEAIVIQLDRTSTRTPPKTPLKSAKEPTANRYQVASAAGDDNHPDKRATFPYQKIVRGPEADSAVYSAQKGAPVEDISLLPPEMLRETIRRQQQEIQELKARIEQLRESSIEKDIQIEKAVKANKQKTAADPYNANQPGGQVIARPPIK